MAEITVRFGPCAGVPVHVEVLTQADDPEQFDPNVLGSEFADRMLNLDTTVFGYCRRCGQAFYWGVDKQEWLEAWERTPAALELERRAILLLMHEGLYPYMMLLGSWQYFYG